MFLGILKLNIAYLIGFELAYSFLDGSVLSALILLSVNFKLDNACLMGFFKLVGPSFIEFFLQLLSARNLKKMMTIL